MNLYYCKHCNKSLQRDSDKAWIKSYCETVEKFTRLMQVRVRGRKYHKAEMADSKGRVSALCYSKPHAIPKTESWTMTGEVTCQKCLKAAGS